jgi:hypothetical protein
MKEALEDLQAGGDSIASSSPSTPSSRTSAPPQDSALSHQAVKASWVCAALVFGVTAFGHGIASRMILERVALLFMVAGFLLGVTTLFGISRHGAKGILVPAVVGILMNGLLIFIFATNCMSARAKAQGMKSDLRPSSSQVHFGNSRV